MQNRSPVGVWGASSNTWPRCEPQRAQRTSVRTMPWLRSVSSSTRSPASGLKKLGHPQCESNFVSERNSSFPHARHA
ncbi:Uncharacterised protein [Mycobacteroides abscessus]|nr:Uncharacterised protein [Mycobacteroides abscessus]